MKHLKKDRNAFNMLYAVAVVAIIIVAGVAFFLMQNPQDDSPMDMTATIVITNVETGVEIQAIVDMSSPDAGEMAMMAFGQGVRETPFMPLAASTQTIPILNPNSVYTITVSAAIDYQTVKIAKLNAEIKFSGQTDTPYMLQTTSKLIDPITYVTIQKTNIPVGSNYFTAATMDNGMAFGFSQKDSNNDGQGDPLIGSQFNNMMISCGVKMMGWTEGSLSSSADVTAETGGTLRLVMTPSGTLGVQVSSMWASSPGAFSP